MHRNLFCWRSLACTAAAILACFSAGCQTLRPDPIPAGPSFGTAYNVAPELSAIDQQPIEIGKPNRVLDTIGTVVGIPSKILLWNRRIDNHKISGQTIEATADYMAISGLGHVKVRANQYAPHKDWQRLKANKSMHWLSRYTLGILSLGGEAILPGRIVGGDHFNPFTQTVHLYSDVPAIAWHELAHAKDFSRRSGQASYGLAYTAIPIWHETIASQDVMSYVADRGDREEIASAVEVLYPAYGTYAGSSAAVFGGGLAAPIYYGSVVASHLNARKLSKQIRNGEDLGPITSVATSSLYGHESYLGNTCFRDVQIPSSENASSASLLAMNFDPKVGIRMPDGKIRELGDQWGMGLAATLDLDSTLDRPVTISYWGNSSESSASWSSSFLDPYGFDAKYTQDLHDVLIGYRIDANHGGQNLHPMSDQLLLGMRYMYFGDQVDERVSYVPFGVNGMRDFDTETTATNHIFAPSLYFQRRYRYGRWTARGQVGAYLGLAGTHQASRTVATDISGQRYGIEASQTDSVVFASGQNAELAIGMRAGSTWSLEAGLRAANLTGVATSIRDYANGEASDTTDILGVGGFVGMKAEF